MTDIELSDADGIVHDADGFCAWSEKCIACKGVDGVVRYVGLPTAGDVLRLAISSTRIAFTTLDSSGDARFETLWIAPRPR